MKLVDISLLEDATFNPFLCQLLDQVIDAVALRRLIKRGNQERYLSYSRSFLIAFRTKILDGIDC